MAAPLALLLLWHRPGRREALVAAGLLAFVAWRAASAEPGFGRFEAAWVCLLAGGTVLALQVRPPHRGDLVGAGLVGVAGAAAAGVALVAVTSFSWTELRWLAERHYGGQVRRVISLLASGMVGTGEVPALLDGLRESVSTTVTAMSLVLPGLVLLQSLAALTAAWAIYRVVARDPDGGPLPSLREFRFNDHLVWGVVLALLVLVLPGLGALRLVGGNLAAFFGGLYVARGIAVVTALAAASGIGGPLSALLAIVVTVIFLPLVAFAALALGVSDTWVDWRRMARAARGGR